MSYQPRVRVWGNTYRKKSSNTILQTKLACFVVTMT